MKRVKVLLISFFLLPILFIFVMGAMLGKWFDAENLLEREDIEVYKKPIWQYFVYYSTLAVFSISQLVIIFAYSKYSTSKFKIFTLLVPLSVWLVLAMFFILSSWH